MLDVAVVDAVEAVAVVLLVDDVDDVDEAEALGGGPGGGGGGVKSVEDVDDDELVRSEARSATKVSSSLAEIVPSPLESIEENNEDSALVEDVEAVDVELEVVDVLAVAVVLAVLVVLVDDDVVLTAVLSVLVVDVSLAAALCKDWIIKRNCRIWLLISPLPVPVSDVSELADVDDDDVLAESKDVLSVDVVSLVDFVLLI